MKTWMTVCSVLGGLFGLMSGYMVAAAGSVFGNVSMAESGGWVFMLSLVAIILGFTAWKWAMISGIALIVLSLIGLLMNGFFFILAGVFMLVAGIMAIIYSKKLKTNITVTN